MVQVMCVCGGGGVCGGAGAASNHSHLGPLLDLVVVPACDLRRAELRAPRILLVADLRQLLVEEGVEEVAAFKLLLAHRREVANVTEEDGDLALHRAKAVAA